MTTQIRDYYSGSPVASKHGLISRAEVMKLVQELTPNRAEQEVLASIYKWIGKAKYTDETGTRWLIRTADEFIADGINLTAQTIQRALRRLRDAGLIILEKGRHLFRKRSDQARNCSWITLPNRTVSGGQFSSNQNRPAKTVPYKEHFELKSSKSNLSADADLPLKSGKGKISAMAKSLSEAMQKISEKVNSPYRPNGNLTATKLYRVYAKTYATEFSPEKVGPAQAAQLKHLNKFLEVARGFEKSDEEIIQAVERVVSHWQAFGDWLHARNKWKIAARPAPVFFYQQAAEILNYEASKAEIAAGDDEITFASADDILGS